MSITDPKIDELREKFNAWQFRQEREYVRRTGSFNGVSRAGKPLRFVIFCQRIEQFERARLRFDAHAMRVGLALSPMARYIASLQTIEFVLEAA